MSTLDQLLKTMDFDFFGTGRHHMSVEGLRKALGNDHFVFLDVRSPKETEYVALPFAKHIPLNELPDRLDELPKDKCIVAFCSSIFRAAVAYTFLLANGYEEAKGLTASLEELVPAFKPGPLKKM